MPYYIDTHCHLDFEAFHTDRDSVLERATQAGINRIVNPAIDVVSAINILALCQRYPYLSAAVGVHPNSATTWQDDTREHLRELAASPDVVAVGEIGLDYYQDFAPRALQRVIFKNQLAIAAELELPVIIHNRNATTDILSILSDWMAELRTNHPLLWQRPGVLHSFSGDLDEAQQAAGLNFMIGITGPVTYKNAPEMKSVARDIAMKHILIETDAPFLAPHPHRGKRNEPAHVVHVAGQIAALRDIPLDEVAAATTQNAELLFGWSVSD